MTNLIIIIIIIIFITNNVNIFYSNNCSSRLITKVLITLSNVSVSYTETIFKDYDFN